MVPKLPPTKPPISTWFVPVTAPVAQELVITPACLFRPTRPPTIAARLVSVDPTPLTSPLALEFEICPLLKPTRPPAALLNEVPVAVVLTLPEAFEPVIAPAF